MDNPTRILVVDDDENIREAIAAILEKEGYIVEAVGTGKEAIEKSNSRLYNLALIDIRLPDMEGTELLTKMKETTPKMRKIIMTGYPALENAVYAVNKDANAYLIKPIEIGELLNIIKAQLKKQEEEKKYSQEKVVEFIETRAREIQELTSKV